MLGHLMIELRWFRNHLLTSNNNIMEIVQSLSYDHLMIILWSSHDMLWPSYVILWHVMIILWPSDDHLIIVKNYGDLMIILQSHLISILLWSPYSHLTIIYHLLIIILRLTDIQSLRSVQNVKFNHKMILKRMWISSWNGKKQNFLSLMSE